MFLRSSPILVLTGAMSIACDQGPTPPVDAPRQPAKPAFSLEFIRDSEGLTVRGTGPIGTVATLYRDLDRRFDCPLGERSNEVTEVDGLNASAAMLPVEHLLSALCNSDEASLQLDSATRRVTGTLGKWDSRLRDVIASIYQDEVHEGWTFSLTAVDAPNVVPSGYGSLEIPSDIGPEMVTLFNVDGQVPFTEPLGAGARLLLRPGIYRASNGDHFAIREGFRTNFRPGNPAAVVLGGKRFPLDEDIPSVGLDSNPELSFHSPAIQKSCAAQGGCFGARVDQAGKSIALDELAKLRSSVRQVVIHSDGAADSAEAFRYWAARQVSTHLGIDFDGTVIQYLDLGLNAYHAGPQNLSSIGVDLNNSLVPLHREFAAAYPEGHTRALEMSQHPRPISSTVRINGHEVKSYGYTEAQWRSMLAVSRLLLRIFPAIAPNSPTALDGEPETFALAEPGAFSGFVGHSHTSEMQWDPGPGFDWNRLAEAFAPDAAPR